MNRKLILLITLLKYFDLEGQVNFNILPDVGGIGGQAMSFIAIPDTNSIKIIGHRFDTILPGSNDKPWLGEFDYSGNIIDIVSFLDSQYTKPFNVFNNPLAHKEDDIYYYYARRHVQGTYFTPYLIEFDLSSGEVLRSKLIEYNKDPTLPYSGTMIRYEKKSNTIVLLNVLHQNDSLVTYITLLDTLFNIKKVVKVNETHTDNFPFWCKANTDSTFIIIGDGLFGEDPLTKYSQIYFTESNVNGQVVQFKLLPTSINLGFGLPTARTILQLKNGDLVISGLYYDDRSNVCSNCFQLIPYIVAVSSEFDSLRWQTKFYDIPYSNSEQYFLHSMTLVDDGVIVAGDFLASTSMQKSGVLFKASLGGDSLWMKHFIPLDWDSSRVAWVNFNDVQVSPYGTVIVSGAIGDLEEQNVRPWILQLDKDGCLVPGCNLVSTEDQSTSGIKKVNFKICPNPVSEHLYLFSTITSTDPVNIQVISNVGSVIKTRQFYPVTGSQYILSCDGLNAGIYHLVLTCSKTNQVESHAFFVK